MLSAIFSARDVEVITKIPLCINSSKNILIWHFERKGEYLVKSRYHIGRRFLNRMRVELRRHVKDTMQLERGYRSFTFLQKFDTLFGRYVMVSCLKICGVCDLCPLCGGD